MVVTGLTRILEDREIVQRAGRIGLLYNQASVDDRFRPAADLINEAFPGRLRVLFGPQHGAEGTEQDNMIETDHSIHPRLGLPVYSLYADARRPRPHMLADADTILVDIQDVGTRVYTFATTVLYLMQTAADTDRTVMILDRPNPVNGVDVEGNLLDPKYASFVGPFPIPMRHGMTMGELMRLYNEAYQVGCRLEVVPMKGWRRGDYFDATGLPWVLPSPNMPTVETAVVYPGQVILEGTNLSEGRGTTKPFEIFGAPFMDPVRVVSAMEPCALEGVRLRYAEFRPSFNKWSGELCRGFQIHVTDRRIFRPYRFTLALLSALMKIHRGEFRWSEPPYEYVYDKLPVDVILGDARVRQDLESGRSVLEMEESWRDDLVQFLGLRSRYLIYDS